ncbi:MAG: hypothetical protein ACRC2V_06615 [Xenococcaceae cyanobacterium]
MTLVFNAIASVAIAAIADYTKAIQLAPKSAATTYSKRAVARDRIGDKKGADEDRKAAASLPPEPEQRVFQTIGFSSRQCEDKSHPSLP